MISPVFSMGLSPSLLEPDHVYDTISQFTYPLYNKANIYTYKLFTAHVFIWTWWSVKARYLMFNDGKNK